METIKLWPLNDEFEITLIKDNVLTWPEIKIRKDGLPLMRVSLTKKSVKDVMENLFSYYPDSKFLKELMKSGV